MTFVANIFSRPLPAVPFWFSPDFFQDVAGTEPEPESSEPLFQENVVGSQRVVSKRVVLADVLRVATPAEPRGEK